MNKIRLGRRQFLQLAGGAAVGLVCGSSWVGGNALPWGLASTARRHYPGPVVPLNQELIKSQGRWLG